MSQLQFQIYTVFAHFELSVNLVWYLSDKSRQKWDLQNSCMDRTSEGYGKVHAEYLAQKCKLVGMGAKCLSYISERVFVRFPIDFCVRSTYPNAKPLESIEK